METNWKIEIYDSSVPEIEPEEQDYHVTLEEKTTETERKPRKRVRRARAAQQSNQSSI